MTRMRRFVDALWPAALLFVFLSTFRRTRTEASGEQSPGGCDEAHAVTVAALEQCLALDTRNVEVLTAIGDVHAQTGAPDRAEDMYRRALAIDPRDGEVHLRLGELLLARGDARGARSEAQDALTSEPGNPVAERLIERASRESHW